MLINKTQYTISQVEDILNSHLDTKMDCMLVTDFALAHYIYDYISNDYGMECEHFELSSDVNEYYVSLSFFKDEIGFFIEFAKWDQKGDYKYDETDETYYYIFSDMSFGDTREYLSSKGILEFCELVDNDIIEDVEIESMDEESYLCKCCSCGNDNCDEYNCTCGKPYSEDDNEELIIQCDCPDCVEQRRLDQCNCDDCDCKDGSACDGCGREVEDNELEELCMCNDCRSQRHDDIVNTLVGKAFEKITNADECPNCIIEALFEMSLEMKRLGWNDHQSYITECNG